jgi:hypothetical protein
MTVNVSNSHSFSHPARPQPREVDSDNRNMYSAGFRFWQEFVWLGLFGADSPGGGQPAVSTN